jgi:hypothetical protein
MDPDEPGCETELTGGPADLGTTCDIDSECADSNVCNGVEVCYQNKCFAGTPINCGGSEVLQGDVTISNGLDIKALEGIEIITGNVTIQNTLLSSLIGLEFLKTIGGDLIVVGNTNLIKLSGSALSNLEFVGGDIVIQNNKVLTSINLPSLVTANLLIIDSNSALKAIDGYPNLALLGEGLTISNNPVLASITGFPALQRIGAGSGSECEGPCGPEAVGGLDLTDLPALAKVDAFAALSESEGGVFLQNFTAADLELPALVDAGAGFEYQNGRLKNLKLPKLETTEVLLFMDGYYSNGGQTFEPGALETISAPKLKDVTDEYSLSGVSALKSITLGAAWKAGNVDLHLTSDLLSLSKLGIDGLTEVEYLWLYVGDGYYYTADINLAKVEFSKLAIADDIRIDFSATGISTLSFPKLKSTGSLTGSFYYSSEDLVTLGFPVVETIDSLYLSEGDGGPPNLATMDFSALNTVEDQLSVYLGIPASGGQGFLMGSLTVLGSNAQGSYSSVCTGTVNGACGVVSSLTALYPSAYIDDCGQCGQQF